MARDGILAGDAARHDEFEIDIMDIEEACEAELGEGGLDHRVRAHLIHAVVEAVDILELNRFSAKSRSRLVLLSPTAPGV